MSNFDSYPPSFDPPGKKQKGGVGKSLRNIALALLAVGALGLAAFLIVTQTNTPNLDEYGCRVDGTLPKAVVFFFDQSDPLSPIEAEDIEQHIQQRSNTLKEFELLSIWKSNPENPQAPIQVLHRCSPGTRNITGFDAWTTNPNSHRAKWQEALGAPLANELQHLLEPNVQSTSPIIESILELSKLSFFRSVDGDIELFIVSDLLQNTPASQGGWNVFSANSKDLIGDFQESKLSQRRIRNMERAKITAYWVERPEFVSQQNNPELSEFWEWYFEQSAAEYERIGYGE